MFTNVYYLCSNITVSRVNFLKKVLPHFQFCPFVSECVLVISLTKLFKIKFFLFFLPLLYQITEIKEAAHLHDLILLREINLLKNPLQVRPP